MKNVYQQVHLQKASENGVLVDTVWIPQKFAFEGANIKRKIDGEWSEGWKVVNVYEGTLDEQEVIASRDRYKHHREGTDI